tara:strand:+ start:746 stop:847 length:102 start_codon:yes stop_codon:yes gene_type:complete
MVGFVSGDGIVRLERNREREREKRNERHHVVVT